MKNTRKTIEVNKNLWVHDYGDEVFEVCLRAWGPLGAYVYRYEKGRLKYCMRKSYGGVSSPKYFNFFKSDWWTDKWTENSKTCDVIVF